MSPSIPLMKLTRWQCLQCHLTWWQCLQCHLTCSSQGQIRDSVPVVEIVENTLSKVSITQDTSTSHLNRNCTQNPTWHWPRTMQVTWHILLWWDCLGSIRLMLSSLIDPRSSFTRSGNLPAHSRKSLLAYLRLFVLLDALVVPRLCLYHRLMSGFVRLVQW